MAIKAPATSGPLVTVEVAVLAADRSDLMVLLEQRSEPPFAGTFALPSDAVRAAESTEEAAQRVLARILPPDRAHVQQLYTFSHAGRDPRGPSLAVAYLALLAPEVVPHSTDRGREWRGLRKALASDLAFDHARILDLALRRLQGRLTYTQDAFHLLPARFTIPQLQHIHEVVLGERLKPDVFIKRVREDLRRYVTRETATPTGAGRPARLYRNPSPPPSSGVALVAVRP